LQKLNQEQAKGFRNEKMEEPAKICKLCGREQPLYFHNNEEAIKKLPEKSLKPLL
jgi:hypothetical protein